jgi:hypothetical protein
MQLVSDALPGGISVVDAWPYRSDSRAATYEVTLWDSGHVSCTCAGWVFARKTNLEKFGYPRWCKHVGDAWDKAVAALQKYSGGSVVKPTRRPLPAPFEANENPVQFVKNKNKKNPAPADPVSLRPTRAFEV